MVESYEPALKNSSEPIAFQTEVKQLLNILIHSLYTDQEIFLRELISNASDALTQMRFVQQTEREYIDPEVELRIDIALDEEKKMIIISDTGVGMTREEISTNLGTIAQSGARAFLEAVQSEEESLADVIGRFGVGFYSVFMAAEWVKVNSRSYQPEAKAVSWFATGSDTFQVGDADREERGTKIIVKLKEDAHQFADKYRIRETIKKHSDYVAYPIYLEGESEQINRQKAIWRQRPSEVDPAEYQDFYKQLTLDFQDSLAHIHFVADAPLKIFALLYIPAKADPGLFTLREQDGLKLYTRKVLIDQYKKDLLPPYYRFVQGVVDAEDLPLNVSRESVQANAMMTRLKGILTNQVNRKLLNLAEKEPGEYAHFWKEYGQFVKEGIASDEKYREELTRLLRFRTTTHPEEWTSLEDYISRMPARQDKIYYILGGDVRTVSRSPHLDYFQTHCYEVLVLTDPVDSFMIMGLKESDLYTFQNVAASDLELPRPVNEEDEDNTENVEDEQREEETRELVDRFKEQLGDKVSDVRTTTHLTSSAARLVDPEGAMGQELQKLYQMMDQDFESPAKVLELNPVHPILQKLAQMDPDQEISTLIIDQIYESAMLLEGIHPDPAGMIPGIYELMRAALKS